YPAIHAVEQAGHAGYSIALELEDLHAALGNEGGNRTVNVAASGETSVERIIEVLPPCQTWTIATTVLEEDGASTRFEHPLYVLESPSNIGDAAQGPGGDHTIEAGIRKRQHFCRTLDAGDGHMDGGTTASHTLLESQGGVKDDE